MRRWVLMISIMVPLTITGTHQQPVFFMPATAYYDMDLSSIRGELSTYRLIYGIGQVIHGGAYLIRR